MFVGIQLKFQFYLDVEIKFRIFGTENFVSINLGTIATLIANDEKFPELKTPKSLRDARQTNKVNFTDNVGYCWGIAFTKKNIHTITNLFIFDSLLLPSMHHIIFELLSQMNRDPNMTI